MIKNRFFRKAFVCSAIVGFAASIAGCNLGFMESEDSDLVAYLEESTTAAFSGTYKAKASGEVTLKLSNGSFSTALKNAVANATATSTVDVSNYFDLTLVDDSGTDVTSTLIREQKVYALGAVTSTSTTSSGKTSLTPDTETLSVKIVIKMQDGGTAETASGNLYVTATGDATASGNIMTCLETTLSTFEITTAEVSLQAASTAQLCTAAATTAAVGKGVAVLSLGGITSQAVSKGDAVATGSIGTDTTVTAYALTDCEEEASSIPVYIDSDVYTGAVSLTVDSALISNTTVTATNCSNIKVVYYGQNFESVSDATTVVTSPNCPAGLSIATTSDTTYNKYLKFNLPSSTNSRSAYMAISNTATSYTVEFDAALTAGTNQESQFALLSSAASNNTVSSSYLFALNSTASTTWTVNGSSSTTVTLTAGTFYHYKLVVDGTAGTVTVKITDESGSTVLAETSVTPTDTSSYTINYVNMLCGRYATSTQLLDNFIIYQ